MLQTTDKSRPSILENRFFELIVVLLVSLFVLYDQVFNRIGLDFLWNEALRGHRAVIEGKEIDPWQFRVLSPFLLEGIKIVLNKIGFYTSYVRLFIYVRFLQTVAIFLLASRYWEKLGTQRKTIYLLFSILAWGMTYSTWGSDLAIDTYFDILFYVLAVLATISRKYQWILPLSILSALNRETGFFIPLLPVLAAIEIYPKIKIEKRAWQISIVGALLFISTLVSIRLILGPRPGLDLHPPGMGLLLYNLHQESTYFSLFATYSILPVLALVIWRVWPKILKRFFFAIIPLWIIVHFLGGIVAEARLFLVPYTLIILPAVGVSFNEISQSELD